MILFRRLSIVTVLASLTACSVFATRPQQEMSDTASALRAAREAQSETLAPELYRQANDWWLKARQEYKFKNFSLAQEFAEKARSYAEQAEYISLKQGATRVDLSTPEPEAEPVIPPGRDAGYETPRGKPVEAFEPPPASGAPSGAPSSPKP